MADGCGQLCGIYRPSHIMAYQYSFYPGAAEDGYMFPATFGAANISGLPKTSEAKVTVERVNGNTVTITAKYTATGA